MKKAIHILKWSSLFMLLFLLSACGATRQTFADGDSYNLGYARVAKNTSTNGIGTWERNTLSDNTLSLADMLLRIPGVRVTGRGPDALVTVRGISSFSANIEPLFVVDGMGVGFGLGSVSYLSPMDVDNISVLKDSAASIYGVRGAAGVIVIETKSQSDRNRKRYEEQ